MSKEEDKANKTSRRSFAKSAATAIAIVPFASSLLSAQGRKKRKRRFVSDAELEIRQGSPITVGGGGSVGIGFDKGHYKATAKPGEFSNPDDELIATFVAHQNGKELKKYLKEIKGKSCRVTFSCLDAKGNDSPIVIESHRHGPLTLRFTLTDYPYSNVQEVHYNAVERKVAKIVVSSSGKDYPFEMPDGWKGVVWNDDL